MTSLARPQLEPNQFHPAAAIGDALPRFRALQWRAFDAPTPVPWALRGEQVLLRPGLTFTPYANPRPCNAHCAFCSEELWRTDAKRLSAKTLIADHDQYFATLDAIWRELHGFPIGLSLSGLEATADATWLLRMLELVRAHSGLLIERVLYTNGSGLCADARLLPALVEARFHRVEISRCHFDEALNLRVMKFDRAEPVRTAQAFEAMVRRAIGLGLAVKLVCILNREAIATIDQVEAYVSWAARLGVNAVVFRELSELGELYRPSRETRWIAQHRVSAQELAQHVLSNAGARREGWSFLGVTCGYYYFNELHERAGVTVAFEGSDYVAQRDQAQAGVVHKLVFHSTGELSGDWVPGSHPIGVTGD